MHHGISSRELGSRKVRRGGRKDLGIDMVNSVIAHLTRRDTEREGCDGVGIQAEVLLFNGTEIPEGIRAGHLRGEEESDDLPRLLRESPRRVDSLVGGEAREATWAESVLKERRHAPMAMTPEPDHKGRSAMNFPALFFAFRAFMYKMDDEKSGSFEDGLVEKCESLAGTEVLHLHSFLLSKRVQRNRCEKGVEGGASRAEIRRRVLHHD